MAKITSTEANRAIYNKLAPLIADLSEALGYVVPIYWPAMDYSQEPDETVAYVDVEEVASSKEPEGIEADDGSEATAQLRVTYYIPEHRGDLGLCRANADKVVREFSRGRVWFDLADDKSVVLMPCVQEPLQIREGRRILPVLITYNYETY